MKTRNSGAVALNLVKNAPFRRFEIKPVRIPFIIYHLPGMILSIGALYYNCSRLDYASYAGRTSYRIIHSTRGQHQLDSMSVRAYVHRSNDTYRDGVKELFTKGRQSTSTPEYQSFQLLVLQVLASIQLFLLLILQVLASTHSVQLLAFQVLASTQSFQLLVLQLLASTQSFQLLKLQVLASTKSFQLWYSRYSVVLSHFSFWYSRDPQVLSHFSSWYLSLIHI